MDPSVTLVWLILQGKGRSSKMGMLGCGTPLNLHPTSVARFLSHVVLGGIVDWPSFEPFLLSGPWQSVVLLYCAVFKQELERESLCSLDRLEKGVRVSNVRFWE